MSQFNLLFHLKDLPDPFDLTQAAHGFIKFQEAAEEKGEELQNFAAQFTSHPQGAKLLSAIFGNSPYLTHCLINDLIFFQEINAHPPDKLLDTILNRLPPPIASEDEIMLALRQAKRQVALLAAIADLGGIWQLGQVTFALSALADAAVQLATRHLLLRLANDGQIALKSVDDPAQDSGLCIFGMGKLGGFELNYSSDIDLIVYYDEEKVSYTGKRNAQDAFIKLVRGLVKILQERTADGYVFRTDLRLRPDPTVMPAAISMAAAENYYETLGQNWERAAMIKMRCIAGDIAAGQAFLDRVAPFVWRKNLDFAAINDIHSIKRQIHTAKGHGTLTVPGHNIKIGRGGIREIEFFAQTQQLILGGRVRSLRTRSTCAALLALVAEQRLKKAVAEELIEAYGFLRKLEHRLQMIDDEQTQTLPNDSPGLVHLSKFFGYPNEEAFIKAVETILHTVQHHYAQLFEAAPELGTKGGSLVFTGTEDDPETLKTLTDMGYEDSSMIASHVRGWHHGRMRATRSVRARELLTALMPSLLQALAHTVSPDDAFRRFDEFLRELPSSVQLFSLFYSNPGLLDLVAEIMGTAPLLAERLSRNASLFDTLVTNDVMAPLSDVEALSKELENALAPARDMQDLLDFTRRFANDRRFMLGVQAIRRVTDITEQGHGFSAIADAVLRNLIKFISEDFARNHGYLPGGGMVILGLGKLGAREMTVSSDLDLIFVYDHAAHAEQSDGRLPLAPSQYFARLSQRIINALTALTAEGVLYEVDMRLRPSGNKGPVAIHLDTMATYQTREAWTWEHMALTRARPIAGPADLILHAETLLKAILTAPRDQQKLRSDVIDMHNRLVKEHGSNNIWNIKHVKGGLMDAEFIAQYLLLQQAANHPNILTGDTVEAFNRLRDMSLAPPKLMSELAKHTLFLKNMQGLLRLCYDTRRGEADFPPGLKRLLAKAGNVGDFVDLEDKLRQTEKRIAEAYRDLIEYPK